MRSVELFSGAGGLALGLSRAGFQHMALVERNGPACATVRENQRRKLRHVSKWPLFESDVKTFDFSRVPEDLELLAAGVPCQPFSIGGKHKGHIDHRNMFPETLDAVRRTKPKVVLIENVRGLARSSFANYFSYIQLMLAYPGIRRKKGEDWADHRGRLERHHTRGRIAGLHYKVVARVLNAADYGVPQKRQRVFIVAIRADLGIDWSFPEPTHSQVALLADQYVSRDYWERHEISSRQRSSCSDAIRRRLNKANPELFEVRRPWVTVRDALRGLGEPSEYRGPAEPSLTHFLVSGARKYAGHTGSGLDEPAKTLKAGDHGVPGGENMMAFPSGRVRYFSVRESARLQTFPDEFVFSGSWTESMRQIGNAVPVSLAEIIGRSIANRIRRISR